MATQSGIAAADQRFYSNSGTAEPVYANLAENAAAANTANLRLNNGSTTPTLANNGEVHAYHKGGTAYLAVRLGGTTFAIATTTQAP